MKRKSAYFDYLILAAVLLLAAVCLLRVSLSSNQASLSVPIPLTLRGEYSYDGETWTPLSDVAELSALGGSVILRGIRTWKSTREFMSTTTATILGSVCM